MPESMSPEPPTFFANIATIHVNVDEVSIEFRRFMKPHAELWKTFKDSGGKDGPPLTDDDVYKFEPIAKGVLTFVGAKTPRDNLNKLMTNSEEMRKQGV